MNAPVDRTPQLPETFDLAELKGIMSDEEIEALAAGDDPITSLEEKPAEAPDDGLAAADAEALAEANAAAATAAAAQQAPPVQQEQTQQQTVPLEIPDTTEAQKTVEAFDATLEAIQSKYDEGELTAAEMRQQIAAASSARSEAELQIRQANDLIQQQQEALNNSWISELDKFKAAGNEVLWTQAHVNGFDAELKRITDARIHPEFAGKPFDVLIRTAAKTYAAKHEAMTGQALPVAGVTPKPAADPALKRRDDPRPDSPQLLGGLNGDGGMSVDDGTFASIDRMAASDPLRAEEMLAALPAATREQYLAMAG